MSLIRRLPSFCAGFLRGNAAESATRLSGVSLAFAAIAFAFRYPAEWETCATLLSGMAAALGVRNLGMAPKGAVTAPSPESKPDAS